MKYYDLTGMTEEQKNAIFKAEGSRRPIYVTTTGDRVQMKDSGSERKQPLTRMVPHPDSRVGIVEVHSNSEQARFSVANEHGGEVLTGQAYVDALTSLAREKGWTVVWDEEAKPEPVVEEKPPQRRRGRPKGSKNKPKKAADEG